MSLPSAVLFCPGRGSYGREELGSLAKALRPGPVEGALARADERRAADGLPQIQALDAAPSFKPGTHLEGRNAAALIYFTTLAGLDALDRKSTR